MTAVTSPGVGQSAASGLVLALHPRARVERVGVSALHLRVDGVVVPLDAGSSAAATALVELGNRAASDAELLSGLPRHEWSTVLLRIRELDALGALCYSVRSGGRDVATAEAFGPGLPLSPERGTLPERVRLSRFAIASAGRDAAAIGSAVARARLRIHDPALLGVLLSMAAPRPGAEVAGLLPLPEGETLARLLLASGVLVACDEHGVAVEDGAPLGDWNLHDALFHARTRWGLRAAPESVMSPAVATMPSLVKPPMSDQVIVLPTSATAPAVSLGEVLRTRRSNLRSGDSVMTLGQLGDLLDAAARIQRVRPPVPPHQPYEAGHRPYPSGGACHPLETYVAVARCDGLSQGLYHYDPLHHRLEVLAGREPHAARLVAHYPDLDAAAGPRQVVLVITARFARISRKYDEIAYALLLKEAGAYLQTLYLVATALGLAPCALGGGDASLIAHAIGCSVWEESSVAEFSVGAVTRSGA